MNVFVRPVDRVAGLKADDPLPTELMKYFSRLGRVETVIRKVGRRNPVDHRDFAAQQDVAAVEEILDARMGRVGRAVDPVGFFFLIVIKFFFQMQHGQGRATVIDQSHVLAFFQSRGFGLGHGQRDRDGPGQAVCQPHHVDHGVVIPAAHKAFERTESADRYHVEVGNLARVQLYLR